MARSLFQAAVVSMLACTASAFTQQDVFAALLIVKGDEEKLEATADEELKLTIIKEPFPGIHEEPQEHDVLIVLQGDTLRYRTTWTTPGDGLEDFPTINGWNAAFAFAKVSLVMSNESSQTFAVMHMDQVVDSKKIPGDHLVAFVANTLDIFKSSLRHFDREFMNFYVAKGHAADTA